MFNVNLSIANIKITAGPNGYFTLSSNNKKLAHQTLRTTLGRIRLNAQIIQFKDIKFPADMSNMFKGFRELKQIIVADDAFANITDMSFMFCDAISFNQAIGNWNVAQAVTMEGMFTQASSFNQDVSHWNIGNVRFMDYMFDGATNFNNGGKVLNWSNKLRNMLPNAKQDIFKGTKLAQNGLPEWA